MSTPVGRSRRRLAWILLTVGILMSVALTVLFAEGLMRYHRDKSRERFVDVRLGDGSVWKEVRFEPHKPAYAPQELRMELFEYRGAWNSVPEENGWIEVEVIDGSGETMYRKEDWIAAHTGSTIPGEPYYLHTISDPMKGPGVLRVRVKRPDAANAGARVRIWVNHLWGEPLGLTVFHRSFGPVIWLAVALVVTGSLLLRRRADPSRERANLKTAGMLAVWFLVPLTNGCDRNRGPKLEAGDIPQLYRVHPVRITRTASPGAQGPAPFQVEFDQVDQTASRCVDDAAVGLEVCLHGDDFAVMITNRSGKPVTIDWPEARWIDDDGKSHQVCHCNMGQEDGVLARISSPGGPDTLSATAWPGSMRREIILPLHRDPRIGAGESVADCLYFSTERRWAPVGADGLKVDELRTRMDELVSRRATLRTVLPFNVEEARWSYEFSYVLRPYPDALIVRSVRNPGATAKAP